MLDPDLARIALAARIKQPHHTIRYIRKRIISLKLPLEETSIKLWIWTLQNYGKEQKADVLADVDESVFQCIVSVICNATLRKKARFPLITNDGQ